MCARARGACWLPPALTWPARRVPRLVPLPLARARREQDRTAVFTGTFGALAVMTVISVALGQV
jgi:hypothetical protein